MDVNKKFKFFCKFKKKIGGGVGRGSGWGGQSGC